MQRLVTFAELLSISKVNVLAETRALSMLHVSLTVLMCIS
jgi:hypothetical protein